MFKPLQNGFIVKGEWPIGFGLVWEKRCLGCQESGISGTIIIHQQSGFNKVLKLHSKVSLEIGTQFIISYLGGHLLSADPLHKAFVYNKKISIKVLMLEV